jgi:hypothetical protein
MRVGWFLPKYLLQNQGTSVMLKKIFPGRVIMGAILLLLGYGTIGAGIEVLREWSSIRSVYLMLGFLWMLSGTAILVAAVWLITCLGSRRLPFAIGGSGILMSGTGEICGLLTHVVPCSGPD